MEPNNITPQPTQHRLFQTTPLSQWLTIGLFITLPFVAGYIGFQKGVLMGETIVYQTIISAPSETTPTAPVTSTTSLQNPIDEEMNVPVAGTINLPANGLTLTIAYASSVEKTVVVKDGTTILQTITAPTESRRADSCIDNNQYAATNIKLQDLDFDGDLDLGILSVEAGANCAYDFYTYYLFDKDNQQFSTSTALYFSDGPIVDPIKKSLSFSSRQGIDWNETVYYFRDGKYYLGEKSTLYSGSDPAELKDLTTPGA